MTDASLPVPRRKFFGVAGSLAAGASAVAAGAVLTSDTALERLSAKLTDTESFYGLHQGGISAKPQSHTYLAAFDVRTDRKQELADLLRHWTDLASRLCAGRTACPLTAVTDRAEPDSGDALGLGAARLTVTFGFGPTLFAVDGYDRFGFARHQPYELAELPRFPGDQLSASWTGGDLTVQACADDPQVAFHAIRQLARAAAGVACVRWSQAGFNEGRRSAGTPRNLMGFKDGTMNPRAPAELDRFVWVGYEGPSWMTGGTYLVVRRIRISLDAWDAEHLGVQERVIGRHKTSGAPLGRPHEFDPLDLDATDDRGDLIIPADSHVRLASPQENWGSTILRRSYAYADGASGPDPSGEIRRRDRHAPTFRCPASCSSAISGTLFSDSSLSSGNSPRTMR